MSEQNLGRVRMHYAGQWDILKAYNLLDYVYDGGDTNQNVYVAVQNVDAGIELNNTNYWLKITVSGPAHQSLVQFTQTVSEWNQLDSSSKPFTHYATINYSSTTIKPENLSGITLINNDIIKFSKYCFGIYSVSQSANTTTITIYSVGNPGEVALTFHYASIVSIE